MRNLSTIALVVIGTVAISGCTFNIQPVVPKIPVPTNGARGPLPCNAVLLLPSTFRNKVYVSSFNDRKITVALGAPASTSLKHLANSRFSSVDVIPVPGDGTVSFLRKTSQAPAHTLVLRPRFVQTSSSVRAFRYDITFALALDATGPGVTKSAVGRGTGRAGTYTKSSLQNAANIALAQAITKLAKHFQPTCPVGEAEER